MTETTREQTVFYLRNEGGTVIKITDPNEVARLKRETTYMSISAEEGEVAFADKQKVFAKIDEGFDGELSRVADAGKANE